MTSAYDAIADLHWALGIARWRHRDPDLTYLARLLRPGHTVIDVGANRGLFAIAAARRVGLSGRVHALEPCRENVRTLRLSKRLGRHTSLQVHAMAAGAHDGTAWLRVPTETGGRRRFALATVASGPKPIAGPGLERVQLRRLDSFVATYDVTSVEVLKIDVEGYEMSVLEGAREVLRRFMPTILIECEPRNLGRHGSTERDMLAFLTGLGYRVERMPALSHRRGSPNLLATPAESVT